jgi:pimeloyl-ACP methyl ester carboxylesterase
MDKVRSKDGTLIAFQKSGTGAPLVLVHGTSADHTRWAPVLPPLASRFTVYAMDRRGRGGSGDTDPYAIEREFEDDFDHVQPGYDRNISAGRRLSPRFSTENEAVSRSHRHLPL